MTRTLGLALAAALLATPFAAAADDGASGPGTGPCRDGRGPRPRGAGFYDTRTVTTVTGQVAAVEQSGRRGRGLHLQLQTGSGTLPVHLGPARFLREQGLELAAGDQVEITGSQIAFDGKPELIAQVVKKGKQALALRDAQGVPVWAGRGRGR